MQGFGEHAVLTGVVPTGSVTTPLTKLVEEHTRTITKLNRVEVQVDFSLAWAFIVGDRIRAIIDYLAFTSSLRLFNDHVKPFIPHLQVAVINCILDLLLTWPRPQHAIGYKHGAAGGCISLALE